MDLIGLGHLVRDVPAVWRCRRRSMMTSTTPPARSGPQALRSRDRDEWIKLFHAADLAALPVLHPEEIFADEQVVHAGVVVDLPDPEFGTLRQVGPVVRFGQPPADHGRSTDGRGRRRPPRRVPRPRSRRPRATVSSPLGAPLEGLRVVDFSAFFATASAPACCRISVPT